MSLGMAFSLGVDPLDAQASLTDRPTTRRCFAQIGRTGELRVQLCVALGHSPYGEIFVDEYFSIRRMAESYAELYAELAGAADLSEAPASGRSVSQGSLCIQGINA